MVKRDFSILQKRLKLNKKLADYDYRGERTFVVVAGMNSDSFNLSHVVGLGYYEERMLFFLFLLKYKKTKLVFVTSKGFDKKLFDYYIGFITDKQHKINEIKSRLIHIEIDSPKDIALTQKILEDQQVINLIKAAITNPKTTVLRCYNPTPSERQLAVKLGIPLFGSNEKFDFAGTKSGSRKIFKLAQLNLIPGYSFLSDYDDLLLHTAKLLIQYPNQDKFVIKLDRSASGRGNSIFDAGQFIADNKLTINQTTKPRVLAELLKNDFEKHLSFQLPSQDFFGYINEFNHNGGVIELYITGKIVTSPSVQVLIKTTGESVVISTHEQILGGKDKQKYLGCMFPSQKEYRFRIIKEAKKVADWMAKKGMIGNFAIDFIAVKDNDKAKAQIYPIEINLRKGGTTHPFRIAFYLTSAKYNQKEGILRCGKTPIYYFSLDIIESPKYRGIDPHELVGLICGGKISFSKYTKKGVLIYMPGMIEKFGRFGAICIGHSREEAELYYKKLVRTVNDYAKKKLAQSTAT